MNHLPVELTIDTSLARTILTGFIRSEVPRAGFSRAILNLSGGVDSSLAAYLSAREHFAAKDLPAALGDLVEATRRPQFNPYLLESFQNVQELLTASGRAPDEVAKDLSVEDQAEMVFAVLRHASANKDHRIGMSPGKPGALARFESLS